MVENDVFESFGGEASRIGKEKNNKFACYEVLVAMA